MIKLPSGVEIKNLINDLRIISREASEILVYYYQILKDSRNKSNIIKNDNDKDPVTIADLKVNELVIKSINEKYKDINWEIISEENVKLDSNMLNKNFDWVWILDPLDGTKDFIQGTCDYAMHLSLNFKNRPFLGVVLIPGKDELWISDSEKVWCEKIDGTPIFYNFSKNKNLKDMTLVTSKNHRNIPLNDLINKICFKKISIMGSIGCKIASILRGESDIYICLSMPGESSPKDWDFSAPELILKAAGGAVTDINNEKLTYGKLNYEQAGIIIASNDRNNHGNICLEIKEIIKKYDLYPFND